MRRVASRPGSLLRKPIAGRRQSAHVEARRWRPVGECYRRHSSCTPARRTRCKRSGAARGRRHRRDPQGLSAAVGDLHRAGAARARSSAASRSPCFRCAIRPTRDAHPIHAEIRAPVVYLPEYLHREPLRVLAGLASLRRALPGYRRHVRRLVARLRARSDTRAAIRRFGQAFVLAAELPDNIVALHAHFLHTPASVARYCRACSRGASLELLGARQGHLDDARLGEARKARRIARG